MNLQALPATGNFTAPILRARHFPPAYLCTPELTDTEAGLIHNDDTHILVRKHFEQLQVKLGKQVATRTQSEVNEERVPPTHFISLSKPIRAAPTVEPTTKKRLRSEHTIAGADIEIRTCNSTEEIAIPTKRSKLDKTTTTKTASVVAANPKATNMQPPQVRRTQRWIDISPNVSAAAKRRKQHSLSHQSSVTALASVAPVRRSASVGNDPFSLDDFEFLPSTAPQHHAKSAKAAVATTKRKYTSTKQNPTDVSALPEAKDTAFQKHTLSNVSGPNKTEVPVSTTASTSLTTVKPLEASGLSSSQASTVIRSRSRRTVPNKTLATSAKDSFDSFDELPEQQLPTKPATESSLESMTVAELRNLCKKHNLRTQGRKAEIIERLKEHLD